MWCFESTIVKILTKQETCFLNSIIAEYKFVAYWEQVIIWFMCNSETSWLLTKLELSQHLSAINIVNEKYSSVSERVGWSFTCVYVLWTMTRWVSTHAVLSRSFQSVSLHCTVKLFWCYANFHYSAAAFCCRLFGWKQLQSWLFAAETLRLFWIYWYLDMNASLWRNLLL